MLRGQQHLIAAQTRSKSRIAGSARRTLKTGP
jgi:hypothetical protein